MRVVFALTAAAMIVAAGAASAQSTASPPAAPSAGGLQTAPGSMGANGTTAPDPGDNPRTGQLKGGGDPNLLKNGTGNSQSPAVPTGGATTPGSNPTSK